MTLLDQVRKTISEHGLITRGDRVVVAVSGGPDSLTLLSVLCALRGEMNFSLHVAHLNHQLRANESDADAEFVANLAHEWNLPATIEARDVAAFAREKKLSLEEAAREARYAFLGDVAARVGAHVIAVAHHADDQVETVLMHLLRGAGLAGLRGMNYKLQITNYELRIIRPLLDIPSSQILDYCKAHSLTPRLDRSNLDTTLFRNKLRHDVLPYLEKLNPNLRRVLLHTARALADDYDFLQSQVSAAFERVAQEKGGSIFFDRAAWRALHPALQRGTLRAAVQRLRGELRNIDWTHIEDARRIALEKQSGAQATLPDGLQLRIGYDELILGDETRATTLQDLPLLHVDCIALPKQGVVKLPDSDWVVELNRGAREQGSGGEKKWSARFDVDACRGEIALRRRKPGDRFHPAGMSGHTKSLHEFMIDEKIPLATRESLPLLVDAEKILWVCGWRASEAARVTTATREILQVTFRKKE